MNIVTIIEANNYPVIIGEGLLNGVGELFSSGLGYKAGESKVLVVTSKPVAELFADRLAKGLTQKGFENDLYIMPDGEDAKSLVAISGAYEFMAAKRYKRSDVIVSLGGGAVIDSVGFLASTYMRGIRLVHFPTTLLAQVDSAIGGKTAINIDGGKNLVGTFYSPKLVATDIKALDTLDGRQHSSGMAEVIKYACIADSKLFLKLVATKRADAKIISACAGIKVEYIKKDPFDYGDRRALNFGHTIGHAVEAASGYSLLHGEAVAIGMVAEARIGEKLGITELGTADAIARLCKLNNLPTEIQFGQGALDYISLDKKTVANGVNMPLLGHIGECKLYDVRLHDLR